MAQNSNSPDADYLMSDEIGLVIAKGMQVLYKTNPKNPVDFLAKWLLNQSQTNRREAIAAQQAMEVVKKAEQEHAEAEAEKVKAQKQKEQVEKDWLKEAQSFGTKIDNSQDLTD
jgi:hypothetical protein